MGYPESKIYPERFARPFTPLKDELMKALLLAVPRRGHSPRLAFFKLTDSCQYDCSYCDANEIKGDQLTTPGVKRVITNLAKAGIQMLDLSGGEPTLRQDLPEVISYSNSSGLLTTLNTNGGIDKDYAYWHKLAEQGLFGATFSYDGVGAKADPNVIHLASFLINQLHIFGGIRTVVWKENLDKVFDIGRTCMLNNIFFQAVPAVALNGETSASTQDFTPLDYQERVQLVEMIYRVSKTRGPFANFLKTPKSYLRQVVASPNPNSWHCRHPSSHWLAIDAQGRARICNDQPLKTAYILTGDENPLITKEYYQTVDHESQKCGGCSWYCHWDGNRGQIGRALDELRLLVTIGGLT